MHPLVKLAKDTVESFVKGEKIITPGKLTPEMKQRAGVFVSIKKCGELRGCIGTFEPTKSNIAEEIISVAISSASRDPRFSPVTKDELKDLTYSVDILARPIRVSDRETLNPKKHGIIVECGWRKGLLLPDLQGVDTVEQQIEICRNKADISSDEPIKLYCFEVKRHQ